MPGRRSGKVRQELVDHLRAHHADRACAAADWASLDRRHWEAHGSDLASFLAAYPIQA